MTEREWLESEEPGPMLEWLRGTASERKMRLYAATCCRRMWHALTDAGDRLAVEFGERFADGEESEEAVEVFRQRVEWTRPGYAMYLVYQSVAGAVQVVLSGVERALVEEGVSAAVKQALGEEGETAEEAREAGVRAYGAATIRVSRAVRFAHTSLLRDLFGNPFRPATLDPAWRTPVVAQIAEAAYDERHLPSGHLDPARLAVLSDALEEAGCDDADLLDHLRSPGPHVRGCWAVDLLTGRS